jgi:hypothetical protein
MIRILLDLSVVTDMKLNTKGVNVNGGGAAVLRMCPQRKICWTVPLRVRRHRAT